MAKKIPLRQCVGCGEMKGKRDMMAKRTEEAHMFVKAGNAC